MRCTTDTLPPQGLLQCHITIRLPDDFINSIILIKMHPVVGGKKKKSHPAEFPSDSRVKKNLGESAGEQCGGTSLFPRGRLRGDLGCPGLKRVTSVFGKPVFVLFFAQLYTIKEN